MKDELKERSIKLGIRNPKVYMRNDVARIDLTHTQIFKLMDSQQLMSFQAAGNVFHVCQEAFQLGISTKGLELRRARFSHAYMEYRAKNFSKIVDDLYTVTYVFERTNCSQSRVIQFVGELNMYTQRFTPMDFADTNYKSLNYWRFDPKFSLMDISRLAKFNSPFKLMLQKVSSNFLTSEDYY
jgi:hypothetical protein